jgi:hypothetical protein
VRRSYTIVPADGAQLITEYVKTYPQLTVINTGGSTAYLGDDSSVSSSNGVPLSPGMATVWSNSPALYAAAVAATTLLITDNASNPLTANLPPEPDVWSWTAGTPFPFGTGPLAGTSQSGQLSPGTVQCAYKLGLQVLQSFSGNSVTLRLTSTFSGAATSLASIPVNTGATIYTGIVSGVVIPYGGYALSLVGAPSSTYQVSAASTATLVPS